MSLSRFGLDGNYLLTKKGASPRQGAALLARGVSNFNAWRGKYPKLLVNLNGADLAHQPLRGVNLSRTLLVEARLREAKLKCANLRNAILVGANLYGAELKKVDLHKADLSFSGLSNATLDGADLSGAKLVGCNLHGASFRGANLRGADLSFTQLCDVDFSGAKLDGCRVFGTSAWNVNLSNTTQTGLILTYWDEPTITVDNLEIAQFIYLMLDNAKIRDVIQTITSKVVLILGRFTPKQKMVLDAIRNELRKWDYTPVLFDFDKPSTRDVSETVSILARLSHSIIVDITAPRSVPQELADIIPQFPSVPVFPVLHERASPYGMFNHFQRYKWVKPILRYKTTKDLLRKLKTALNTKLAQKGR